MDSLISPLKVVMIKPKVIALNKNSCLEKCDIELYPPGFLVYFEKKNLIHKVVVNHPRLLKASYFST